MQRAAVIVPLVRHAQPTLVFVRRAAHLRRNPGELAFPGGLVERSDAGARAAALREFEEELGVARERVRVVERLPDVAMLALGITIAPYLGVLEPPVTFALDATETQSVHEIPLAALYAAGALREGIERVVRAGTAFDVPTWLFDYDGLHVWGATARILRDLTARAPHPALVR